MQSRTYRIVALVKALLVEEDNITITGTHANRLKIRQVRETNDSATWTRCHRQLNKARILSARRCHYLDACLFIFQSNICRTTFRVVGDKRAVLRRTSTDPGGCVTNKLETTHDLVEWELRKKREMIFLRCFEVITFQKFFQLRSWRPSVYSSPAYFFAPPSSSSLLLPRLW